MKKQRMEENGYLNLLKRNLKTVGERFEDDLSIFVSFFFIQIYVILVFSLSP